jgi:ribosome-associated translation inhibitor RaiA
MSDTSDDDTSGFSVPRSKSSTEADYPALVDSLDSRLSAQVDKRVDLRVDETMKDRLSVIERAIADLDRAVHELQDRLKDEGKDKKKD